MSAAEAARGVSSFLVPHQSSEDLVALGVPAREARRRTFLRTWFMERLSNFIELILIWAIIIPALVALTLGLTLFFAGIIDAIDGDSATMSITDFLFQHLWDPCQQPLGLMALIFWCSVFLKVAMIILWDRFQNIPQPDCCTDCCNANFCRCLTRCFYYCLALPIVFFEFAWPITTLILLLLTKSCTWQLEASTWVVMSPFILEAFGFFVWLVWLPCLKPIFWCMGLLTDPANFVRSFQRIRYDPQTFNDDTYASSCAICLSDFSGSDEIVLAPCETSRHVFHRGCLASWLRTAQTCPLCRSPLNPRARAASPDLEETLTS